MHAVLTAAVETTAEHTELPFEPWVFGVGAFTGLVALLLFTYAFRSVGTRH